MIKPIEQAKPMLPLVKNLNDEQALMRKYYSPYVDRRSHLSN